MNLRIKPPKQPASCLFRRGVWRVVVSSIAAAQMFGQGPPAVPDRPWHSPEEAAIASEALRFGARAFSMDGDKIYSLAELIDLAETHNPETRTAWEYARARAG